MFKIYLKKIIYLLYSLFLGMVAFTISGILAYIVMARVLYLNDLYSILYMIISGGLGGLLLALFFRMRQETGGMVFAGIVAWLVSPFADSKLMDFIISIYTSFNDYYVGYPDFGYAYYVVFAGVIFGAIFGAMVFGHRSIFLFSVVCALVSIPFGLLNSAMQPGNWIKAWLDHFLAVFGEMDIYFIVFNFQFGIGTGLSIGLYKMLIKRDDEEVFNNNMQI